MKIFFSPQYSSNTYIDLKGNNNILLDTVIADTNKLVTLLELHAGIYVEAIPFVERLAHYYQAVKKYMNKCPNNVLAKSFATTQLGTAKACLLWRDKLAEAGWTKNLLGISERLDVLAGIEEFYETKGLPERLANITKLLETKCPLPKDTTLLLPCSENLFPPQVTKLINSLKKYGVKIEYVFSSNQQPNNNLQKITHLLTGKINNCTLNNLDESFEIIHFKEEHEALIYLANLSDEDFDVWINQDNKQLDNYLKLAGKPVAGSVMTNSNPSMVQLFSLGLGLFRYPQNIHTLIQWLQVPLQPLPAKFRYALADKILKNGGINSPEYNEVIREYLESTSEENEIKNRKFLLETFLPVPNKEGINRKVLQKFVEEFLKWSRKEFSLSADKEDEVLMEQIKKLIETLEAILILIQEDTAEMLAFNVVESWIQNLYDPSDFVQYQAEAYSRFVIPSSANMASVANKIIWCSFYMPKGHNYLFDFLSEQEKNGLLEKGCFLWTQEQENNFDLAMQLNAFMGTKEKLTLIVCDKQGNHVIQKPVLYNMLESKLTKDAFEALVKEGKNQTIKSTRKVFEKNPVYVNFDAQNVCWRSKESQSSLTNLLQNPLDYTFEYIAKCKELSNFRVADLPKTIGNIAHALIAKMFTKQTPSEIIEFISTADFESLYTNTLLTRGMQLFLPENVIAEKTFKEQFKKCVVKLAEFIAANKLTVQGCEENFNRVFSEDGVLIEGSLDMYLKDDNDDYVIIDLKWTNSGTKYKNFLKDNKSMQLAIYKYMLAGMVNGKIKTAYFIMPKGEIITLDSFVGVISLQEESDDGEELDSNEYAEDLSNTDNLLELIRRGYEFRKKEISSGKIEIGEKCSAERLDYHNQKDVFPLEIERNKTTKLVEKPVNKYSSYKCFKNQLK